MQKPFENLNKDRGSIISAIFEDLKYYVRRGSDKIYLKVEIPLSNNKYLIKLEYSLAKIIKKILRIKK